MYNCIYKWSVIILNQWTYFLSLYHGRLSVVTTFYLHINIMWMAPCQYPLIRLLDGNMNKELRRRKVVSRIQAPYSSAAVNWHVTGDWTNIHCYWCTQSLHLLLLVHLVPAPTATGALSPCTYCNWCTRSLHLLLLVHLVPAPTATGALGPCTYCYWCTRSLHLLLLVHSVPAPTATGALGPCTYYYSVCINLINHSINPGWSRPSSYGSLCSACG